IAIRESRFRDGGNRLAVGIVLGGLPMAVAVVSVGSETAVGMLRDAGTGAVAVEYVAAECAIGLGPAITGLDTLRAERDLCPVTMAIVHIGNGRAVHVEQD